MISALSGHCTQPNTTVDFSMGQSLKPRIKQNLTITKKQMSLKFHLISFFLDLEEVMNFLSEALGNQNHLPNSSVILRTLSLNSRSGRTWPFGNGRVVKPVFSTNQR